MAKVQQKISGGWRTMLGAERFFGIRGYLSTAAKQGKNLLDMVTRLFDGRGADPRSGLTTKPVTSDHVPVAAQAVRTAWISSGLAWWGCGPRKLWR